MTTLEDWSFLAAVCRAGIFVAAIWVVFSELRSGVKSPTTGMVAVAVIVLTATEFFAAEVRDRIQETRLTEAISAQTAAITGGDNWASIQVQRDWTRPDLFKLALRSHGRYGPFDVVVIGREYSERYFELLDQMFLRAPEDSSGTLEERYKVIGEEIARHRRVREEWNRDKGERQLPTFGPIDLTNNLFREFHVVEIGDTEIKRFAFEITMRNGVIHQELGVWRDGARLVVGTEVTGKIGDDRKDRVLESTFDSTYCSRDGAEKFPSGPRKECR